MNHKDFEGQGCPFCRAEIKGTEQIVVDPYHDHFDTKLKVSAFISNDNGNLANLSNESLNLNKSNQDLDENEGCFEV